MPEITLDDVLPLVAQLSPADQRELARRLQVWNLPTRETLGIYFEQRRQAGAVTEDLYGVYANPAINITAEELEAALHEFATEWEKQLEELDEHSNNP